MFASVIFSLLVTTNFIAPRGVDATDAAVIMPRTQQMQDTHQEKRAEFQARLSEIKNEHKQKILENINNRLIRINDRWTTHFSNVLTHLSKILEKLGSRGADITSTQELIKVTQSAVDVQATKDYTIQITDEFTLRESAKMAIESLRSDLRSLRDQIKSVREAVHNLFQTLRNDKQQ